MRPRCRFSGSCDNVLLQPACCGLQTCYLHVACCFLYCSCNRGFTAAKLSADGDDAVSAPNSCYTIISVPRLPRSRLLTDVSQIKGAGLSDPLADRKTAARRYCAPTWSTLTKLTSIMHQGKLTANTY